MTSTDRACSCAISNGAGICSMNEELAASAALIFKAMGHPSRLILLDALKEGERCVCELGELVPGELSTASRHLALLKNAGLIADRRQGQKIYYRLTMGCVSEFVSCIAARIGDRNT